MTSKKNVQNAQQQERRLIDLMRQDIRTGFDAVVEAYHSQLLRAAHNTLDDTPRLAHLAEDVVQDGLLKAYLFLRANQDMLTPALKLRAWLHKIVLNNARHCLTTGEHHLTITSGFMGEEIDEEFLEGYGQHYDDPSILFERAESRIEAKQQVRRAKSVLTPDERTAIDIRYLQSGGRDRKEVPSYKQVGEAMNKPVGTVKSLVSHAKAKMRNYLTVDDTQEYSKKLG